MATIIITVTATNEEAAPALKEALEEPLTTKERLDMGRKNVFHTRTITKKKPFTYQITIKTPENIHDLPLRAKEEIQNRMCSLVEAKIVGRNIWKKDFEVEASVQ